MLDNLGIFLDFNKLWMDFDECLNGVPGSSRERGVLGSSREENINSESINGENVNRSNIALG